MTYIGDVPTVDRSYLSPRETTNLNLSSPPDRLTGRPSRHMRRTPLFFFATLGLIIAATFPWDLQNHPHWQKVAGCQLLTGIVRPVDLPGNAALYFPFGFFLPVRSGRARLLIAAVLAALLSGSLELSQVLEPRRFPSVMDVTMNVAGSVAGARFEVSSSDVAGSTNTFDS